LNVFLAEEKAHYFVDTENVSDMGLCFRSERVFPVGTQFHLVFGRPPELPPIIADGIVRWSDGGKRVGVEFTSISPEDHLALLRFVNPEPRWKQA
jgi:hypothetical protein